MLGISVSMAAGVNANYGTMTKPLHVGQGARNAILAAIEGRGGFASTFARAGSNGSRRRSTISAAPSIWPSAASGPSGIPAAA